MSSPQFSRALSDSDITLIAKLAHEIWYEYYVSLIGRAQVDYMVAKFQSVAAMKAQIQDRYEYYVVRMDERAIGYLAVQPRPNENHLFVSKFYLLSSARGSGMGRACMMFIEDLARQHSLARLSLTVNKHNPAKKAYEKLGFIVAESIVIDIGGGFVMDDYRMEKAL